MVDRSSKEWKPYGSTWLKTLWLWLYIPLKIDARAGQHSGYGERALVQVVPASPSHRWVSGRYCRSSTRMSSVSRTSTLGRLCWTTDRVTCRSSRPCRGVTEIRARIRGAMPRQCRGSTSRVTEERGDEVSRRPEQP